MCSTILGPAIAPIVGGYIDQYLGWRWIFYLKTIMGGVLTLLSYIFIKETLYVPNAKQLAPPANIKERLQRLKFNPVSVVDQFLTFLISDFFSSRRIKSSLVHLSFYYNLKLL